MFVVFLEILYILVTVFFFAISAWFFYDIGFFTIIYEKIVNSRIALVMKNFFKK
jgi:hypothetical protein